jgi:type IV pilus assembly protein PilA
MKAYKGFSLIELLIVVAIILILAAIAIPSLRSAHMAANEAAAIKAIQTINTVQVTYNSTYPSLGYAATLAALGGPIGANCVPSSSNACLIDSVLANNGNPAGSGKSGYRFTLTPGVTAGPVVLQYTAQAQPLVVNQTGTRAFCSVEDGVVRVDPSGTCSDAHDAVVVFSPLTQ